MEEQQLNSPSHPEFWRDFYRRNELNWDLGEPSPPFVQLHESGRIAPCRVAVPGCGSGWEVAWLARRGYRVTGIDFAPEALERVAARLAADNLTAELLHADLFDLPESAFGRFDLVLEQTCFCAIEPHRRGEYVAAVHRMLVPSGRLIALFYDHGEPDGPPFTTTPGQVRELFSDHFSIDSLTMAPHSHTRRQGKEWLGVLTRR